MIDASTTSLNVPPSALLTILDVVDRRRGPGVATVRADRAVEARDRGGAHQTGHGHHALAHFGRVGHGVAEGAGDGLGGGPDRPHLLVGRAHHVQEGLGRQVPARRRGPRRPHCGLRSFDLGGQVHDDRQQVRPRYPVDHGVMRLGHHGPAPALQPLDHPDLPEGLGPVELLGHDPPHQLAQLGLAAGGGQGGVAEVVLNVEVRVVHPHRAPQFEGDELHHLAVARDEGELGLDHGHDVIERRLRALEDGHRADVHMADAVLEVQERCVQRAQPVSAHGPLPSPGTAMAQCSDGTTASALVQPAAQAGWASPRPARNGLESTLFLVSS